MSKVKVVCEAPPEEGWHDFTMEFDPADVESFSVSPGHVFQTAGVFMWLSGLERPYYVIETLANLSRKIEAAKS